MPKKNTNSDSKPKKPTKASKEKTKDNNKGASASCDNPSKTSTMRISLSR